MHWIKLTYANTGAPVWVNLSECGVIIPDERNRGCHIFTKRTGPVHVRQTVEQVMKMEAYNNAD